MAGFTKLFNSIVTSSIWSEDNATRIVWITMLAICDSDGIVEGSLPGLARLACVTREETELAIGRLSSPDPDSRTPDHEGRRIEKVPGGWQILNYLPYRERGQAKDGSRAPYMRERRRKAKEGREVALVNASSGSVTRYTEVEAEEEAEAEVDSKKHSRSSAKGSPLPRKSASLTPLQGEEAMATFRRIFSAWPTKRPADNKPAKGNRVPAERAFQSILDSGAATTEELESAAKLYLGNHAHVKDGYVAFVSTFFGEEKGLWAEGVRILRERRAEAQVATS